MMTLSKKRVFRSRKSILELKKHDTHYFYRVYKALLCPYPFDNFPVGLVSHCPIIPFTDVKN